MSLVFGFQDVIDGGSGGMERLVQRSNKERISEEKSMTKRTTRSLCSLYEGVVVPSPVRDSLGVPSNGVKEVNKRVYNERSNIEKLVR